MFTSGISHLFLFYLCFCTKVLFICIIFYKIVLKKKKKKTKTSGKETLKKPISSDEMELMR